MTEPTHHLPPRLANRLADLSDRRDDWWDAVARARDRAVGAIVNGVRALGEGRVLATRRAGILLVGALIAITLVVVLAQPGLRATLTGNPPPNGGSAATSGDPGGGILGFFGFAGSASPSPAATPNVVVAASPTPGGGVLGGNPPAGYGSFPAADGGAALPVGPPFVSGPTAVPAATPVATPIVPPAPTPIVLPTPDPTIQPTLAPTAVPTVEPTPVATPVLIPECRNNIDDDGDGWIDTGVLGILGDPECTGPDDTSESF